MDEKEKSMKKIILVSMLAIAALSVANEKREVEEVEEVSLGNVVFVKAKNLIMKGILRDKVFIPEYKKGIAKEDEKQICIEGEECIKKEESVILELQPTTMEEGLKIKMD